MAQLGIDVTNVEASVPRDPIPVPGWYKCVITSSEVVPSKTDPENGRRLNFGFQVVEGPYAKRTFFTGLNVRNANPVAQEIAMKDLSAIGHAVGVTVINDSEQLHNIPLWVKIKFVPAVAPTESAPNGYEAKNEVTGYKNQNEKVDAPVAAQAGPTPGAAMSAAPAFVPPATATPAAAAPWQPPAGTQAWQAPAQTPAPVATPAPAPLQAPATATPAPVAQVPAPVAVPVTAVDPTTGLAIPPWQNPALAAG